MTTYEFLSYLQRLNISLWRDGEQIRFSAPSGTLTPALREEIRKRKAEMLALLPTTWPATPQPIWPVQRNMTLPLSFAQQRLWFLSQLEPANPVYNHACAIRLTGLLNVAILKQSLNAIVARHEALRTSFSVIQDQPVQYISPVLAIPLPIVDLLALSPAEKEARIQDIAHTEAISAFDLSKGPLVRTTLLRLSEQEHILLLVVHHIVGDAWSTKILLHELTVFYEACEAGQPAHLPTLPIQYADFAVWQREWLQGAVLDQQLAYWSQQLAGAPALLELPTDHPRPSTQTYQGAHVEHPLPDKLTSDLKALSRGEQSTLFMTLLAAFAVLLARYSGQDDIVVGTPMANRTRSEVEALIGFFANTLPIRVDLGDNPAFSEILKQVRTRVLEAYAHQDVPFERLVEHLQPERSLSHAPIVQVLLVMQEESAKTTNFSNMSMDTMELEIEVAKFDVTLAVQQQGDTLMCSWEYSTQLFEHETMVSLGQHFQVLLEAIVDNPLQSIKTLPLLTQREQEQLFDVWNATEVTYSTNRCLHELFETQVEQAPDTIAVVFEEEQLSYAELNCRANQLAHHLQHLGVGPEVLVGVCLSRSIEMIVGLLAILKAGGAFVPLDPTHPYERLDLILQDSRATVLLTQKSLVERLPDHRSYVLCLDDHWQSLAQEPTTNPPSTTTSQHVAYVIYTSGSTGQPKGILIPHSAIVRHAALMAEQYQLQAHDRVLQFTALTFDISLEQIFPTLLASASLILRGPEIWSITEFHKKVKTFGLTVINLPPAYWHQLAQEWASAPERIQDTQLRLVIIGGDKMLTHYVRLWQQTPLRSVRLLNAYGPAETTITSTCFEVPTLIGDEWQLTHMPIGRPTPYRKMYILDANGQPVPVGLAGELYIGGDLLARGYLHNPQMTAERFLPDPFSSDPLARMYKTGDLVRYLHDGTLEFLDRADFQVKLLGMRVELGEIEEALRQLPVVQEAVVMAHEKNAGEKSLFAYIIAAVGERPTVSSLRQALKAKIPEYMIPMAFVFLDALPLSPNGKLDRQALPLPDWTDSENARMYVAPRTPIEEVLVSVWTRVLSMERIGIYDNFFERGGHSLLGMQVIANIHKVFGIHLAVSSIFESPTIASLALRIDESLHVRYQEDAPPMTVVDRHEVQPLSFAQQRLWFLHELDGGNTAYNIPLGMQLRGPLQLAVLSRCLQTLVQRHESLRTLFSAQQGQPIQQILEQLPVELPLLDLSTVPEDEQAQLQDAWLQRETHWVFDLQHGPLWRMSLLRYTSEHHLLVLVIHHIVFDGWSARVFVRELVQLYEAFIQGQNNPLPPLSLQYANYANWQYRWMQEAVEQEQLAYWTQQLSGAPPLLTLPTDHARPSQQSYRGVHFLQPLPSDLYQQIKVISREQQVTPFMTLLAAFAIFLGRYSGQDDVVIGTPIANRSRPEVADLIGLLVNTLALRLHLAPQTTFAQMLTHVRNQALQGYAHQDLPFERLVEELHPERSLSHTPLFQVMFVHQHMLEHEHRTRTLQLQTMELDTQTAKFDLMLLIYEQADGMQCIWEYATDLFEAETIERMSRHFVTLLSGLLRHPEQNIDQVPLLSKEEQVQLLHVWNATQQTYPDQLCLHQLVEQQVRQTPDAIALVFEQEQLSYQVLDQQANRLAHALQTLGIGPESRVGVCLERSLDMVIALYAILKAGAAYVPLDPESPAARLAFMVDDAQISVLVTWQRLTTRFSLPSTTLLCLDTISAYPEHQPPCAATADHLAYVIYTSGSTGQPKGAMNTHRGIINRLLWMQDAYQLTHVDRVVQKTPFSFDVSVWEFFWSLFTGATLVLAQPGGHRDSAYLVQLIREHAISTLHFVPSMLSLFLEEEELQQCGSIRQILCSGEALTTDQQQRFFSRFHHAQLHNLYGPTEAAVDVTAWTCKPEEERTSVPIGHPIANLQIYILDRYLQPVPIGVAGELYIGGVGVGRGYLGRPALTAEKFVPDPFSIQPGERLYRTSDLARFRVDGSIEYLGRMDFQVKLRGLRIELGEIEATLLQHERVQECVVIVHEDHVRAEKRLVAYLVFTEEQQVSPAELHQYLQSRLPQYMIPALFLPLARMPLNANGKLDRQALPPPRWTSSEETSAYVAPRTPIEDVLVSIWTRVLGVEPLGIHDNFFVLGGDSIRSIHILALMKERGLNGSLQQVFTHQTIAQLARALQNEAEVINLDLPQGPFCLIAPEDQVLMPPDIEDAYPLTAMQTGMLYHLLLTPDNPLYQNVASLHLQGTFDEGALRQAFRLLIARHANLRTSFDLNDYSEPLQLVHKHAEISFIVEDLRDQPQQEQVRLIDELVQREKHNIFDLTQPPLVRVHIYRRTDQTFQLTITEFHPILDGWSYHLNLVELFRYHDLLLKDEIIQLEPQTTTFRDYVALEQQVMQSEQQQRYWMEKLSDSAFLQIPRLQKQWPQTTRTEQAIRSYSVPVSSSLAEKLWQLSKTQALPLKSILLTAQMKLLSILGGTDDVLTGLVGNGRLEVTDGDDVRGLFLLAVPFRLNIMLGSWIDLIHAIFAEELAGLPYRRYPLPAIQEDLGGKRLFETAFNYMHFHSAAELFKAFQILEPVKALEETNYTLQSDFMVSPVSSEIFLKLGYDANLIGEMQIRAIAEYYQRILHTMADYPHTPHQSISVLSSTETQKLLVDWNETATSYTRDSIHHLFEEQVRKTPDAIALVFENEQLTYQELNARANQVANYLRMQGMQEEMLVGISIQRSPLMMIGLLGILKAGAAYLPLDPAHPSTRLATIIIDAGAKIILTEQELVEHLPEVGQRNLCLDSQWALFANTSADLPLRPIHSEHAMYVMYTSGSTGTPKGVLLTHRSVANFFAGMDQRIEDAQSSKTWLAVTSISFDISVLELFWTLTRGWRVIIQPRLEEMTVVNAGMAADTSTENTAIPIQIIKHHVTHLQCTPSFMKMLLMLPESGTALKKLSVILLGGEAFPVALAEHLKQITTASIMNMYGPTETTIWSTTSEVEDIRDGISLGQPIANTEIYILDKYLQPVPIGVPGELFIAGDGLARGYLHRPEITAERFIPNPFVGTGLAPVRSGARLYQTGDLARYLPDGHLEYLGRLDQQIKLNGQRIELGEIEATLHQQAGVQECVVLAQEISLGQEKRLVAYVVPENGAQLEPSLLRQAIQAHLPPYMVPATILLLKKLPMTVNGKLDIRALPIPDNEQDDTYEPPRTALEEQLVAVWSQVLRRPRIGIHDNFFALGGDSITSVQIATRSSQTGLALEIRHILTYQTIANIAAALDVSILNRF